jgi:hypothetical protein
MGSFENGQAFGRIFVNLLAIYIGWKIACWGWKKWKKQKKK